VRLVALLPLWLHLLGVVLWLGGLLYQTHVLLPLARRGQVATFVEAARRQRPLGWTALALVVLTGFYNVTQLGPVEEVMESGAGLFLAGKFILVLMVIAVAGQRDFTHLVHLQLALHTNTDPTPTLRVIAWFDRITILLALTIMYLGVAASRA
jgi:putative copper export protein